MCGLTVKDICDSTHTQVRSSHDYAHAKERTVDVTSYVHIRTKKVRVYIYTYNIYKI